MAQFDAGEQEPSTPSYLMSHEFAQTAEDVLERRTKLGLDMSEEETSRLRDWMLEKRRETELV